MNQFGYLADGPRFASVVNESTSPLDWELVDEAGTVVGQGKTELTEPDKGVNATVHTVDLSAVTATGSGFVLRVAGEEFAAEEFAPEHSAPEESGEGTGAE